ncbi:concanavalin A-like lectin/glucanase domain-containing protein [Microdochium trichocladiopsis]|uniref:Concanavalin A-like lectin/glucanase domain-containing protein n=1 Tax=Microdochium trichocladiopsis TaxID=1682393 RepID=A0A9P8XSR9_9PEZI|nr:concanavalin A-like lectin/glucanase domain-containing protein [Microdochium trichocladiopsis]KAH7014545.1 concanavalin A-like lectin/glucanase domain-containing protein [Microdochium trichocladiopsis]
MHSSTLYLLSLPLVARAVTPPSYNGFTLRWSDGFGGAAGSSPNPSNWNIITGNLGVNNELETYSSSSRNVQISGGNTVQLVPWRDGSVSGGWTSGRIESKYTVTPDAGRVTRVEAQVRFGTNDPSRKQGMWPAFWMLGQALRQGTGWPACGELDILETVSGRLTGYGTVHCDVYPGGICNEGNGIGSSIGIPDQSWHTWRLEWDRTSNNWQTEAIRWSMDGNVYQTLTGSRIGNQNVWNSLAHSPFYFILNMAVGGNWPGYPDGNTLDGYGSMMEVAYVAHYAQAGSLSESESHDEL